MLTLIIITSSVIFMYLMYPVWLILQPQNNANKTYSKEIDNVSVIYLSRNGKNSLNEKITVLLNELSVFKYYELIIIDDNSTDGSLKILNKFRGNNVLIFQNSKTKGIPHSMNFGVKKAKYENIVFCDQRQLLSKGIIKRLVAPFENSKVGAVSACVSDYDKMNCFSILRAHENFIKKHEGKTGDLIGVYGPLYAIKKICYSEIPDHIILDDLYLTLHIISKNKVLFLPECQIYDENIGFLYDYKRTKRYLFGFLQILSEKDLLSKLSIKKIVMLLWHKYLRLVIPILLFISYVSMGIESINNTKYITPFIVASTIIIISTLVSISKPSKIGLINIIKLNIYYLLSFFNLGIPLANYLFSLIKKNNRKSI